MAEPDDPTPDDGATNGTGGVDRRRARDAEQAKAHHRRVEDVERRGNAEEPGRAGWREHMQRLKVPLIGLGLVGLSLPMAQATMQDEDTEPARDTEPAEPATVPAPGGDVEDDLVNRISDMRQDDERTTAIDDAVSRYGISEDLAGDIYDVAREQDIEPRLAYGLVNTESTFDERAVSNVGARGLTQVMPRTAAWLVPGTRTEDLYDRQTNLRLGFRYLDQMIDKYDGDVRLALLAYNRGPGTVDGVLKRGGDPDNGYADKVLRGR